MSGEFDPYHRWLGIPPRHQPADYYRLLGLELFEDDPEVIHDAAERQMAHVRTYQLGPQSELSQKILNELGVAKACLLEPSAKAAYDQQLADDQWQAQLRVQAPSVPSPPPPPRPRSLTWTDPRAVFAVWGLSVLSLLAVRAVGLRVATGRPGFAASQGWPGRDTSVGRREQRVGVREERDQHGEKSVRPVGAAESGVRGSGQASGADRRGGIEGVGPAAVGQEAGARQAAGVSRGTASRQRGNCGIPRPFCPGHGRGERMSRIAKGSTPRCSRRKNPGRSGWLQPLVRKGDVWVSLVGLIPFLKQQDAYREAFRDALDYDPQRDVVLYQGYQVQRLEISSPGDAVSPDWTKAKKINSLESNPAEEAKREWSGHGQAQLEVVDPKYFEGVQPLVFPLGPLVGRFWGASVAHEPEIPLRANELASQGSLMLDLPADPAAQDLEPIAYRLFRFLDFNVEPGKCYRYRVCLVLANPNYKRHPAFLSDPKFAADAHLETEWSKPSAVVSAPGDTGILLMSVCAAVDEKQRPISHRSIDEVADGQRNGRTQKMSLVRGQIANFSAPMPRYPAARPEFATDTLAVDFRGDAWLSRKFHDFTEPGEILLLTPGGNLVVHDEIDDASTCANSSLQEMRDVLNSLAWVRHAPTRCNVKIKTCSTHFVREMTADH